jgi:hypothetical protein
MPQSDQRVRGGADAPLPSPVPTPGEQPAGTLSQRREVTPSTASVSVDVRQLAPHAPQDTPTDEQRVRLAPSRAGELVGPGAKPIPAPEWPLTTPLLPHQAHSTWGLRCLMRKLVALRPAFLNDGFQRSYGTAEARFSPNSDPAGPLPLLRFRRKGDTKVRETNGLPLAGPPARPCHADFSQGHPEGATVLKAQCSGLQLAASVSSLGAAAGIFRPGDGRWNLQQGGE